MIVLVLTAALSLALNTRKLLKVITARLQEMVTDLGPDAEFREPFLGSGSVALAVLSHNRTSPSCLDQ